MNRSLLKILFLLGLSLLLASCFEPKTPQQVTQAFWKSVLNNNAKAAVKYSTLNNAKFYDAFSKDWDGYQPKWGRVTIDQTEASVVSHFSAPANSGRHDRDFVTFLVQQGGTWKVDYERTKQAINGGILNKLIDQLGSLGDNVSHQLSESSERFKTEMDKLAKQLEQMADSLNKQATQLSDQYLDELRKNIQELEDSINRALQDNKNLNDKDRHTLRVAADNLHRENTNLAHPDAGTLSQSAVQLGDTRRQLDSIDSPTLDRYRQQWDELSDRIEGNIRDIISQLQSAARGGISQIRFNSLRRS